MQMTPLYQISQPILNLKNAVKTFKIYNNKFLQYKLVKESESEIYKRKVVNNKGSEMIREHCLRTKRCFFPFMVHTNVR